MKIAAYKTWSVAPIIMVAPLLAPTNTLSSLPLSYQSRFVDEQIKNLNITQFQIEGLTLQRAQTEDFGKVVEIYQDQKVLNALGYDIPDDMLDQALKASEPNFINYVSQWETYHHGHWMVYDHDGSCIGIVGLLKTHIDDEDEIEILVTLKPAAWGKGYATKIGTILIQLAFEKLNMESIIAYTLPSNTIATHLLKNFGFIYEKDIMYQDKPHIFYHLTKEEYEKIKDVTLWTPYTKGK